jgi:hypothetical protein
MAETRALIGFRVHVRRDFSRPPGLFSTRRHPSLRLESCGTSRVKGIGKLLPSSTDRIVHVAIQNGNLGTGISRFHCWNITQKPRFPFFDRQAKGVLGAWMGSFSQLTKFFLECFTAFPVKITNNDDRRLIRWPIAFKGVAEAAKQSRELIKKDALLNVGNAP